MTYRSPTTAMRHQVAARAACDAKPPVPCPEDVFAYLMDMGTGKSKVVLDEFGEGATNGGPQDLLVIGPAGSYRNWFEDKSEAQPSELNRHCDPEFRERLIDVPWSSGGGVGLKNRLRLMLAASRSRRPRALFVNVEALSQRDRAYELCDEFLEQRGAMMVVDESTTIKGVSADRAKNVIRLGEKALSKRILSGLWTPKSPMDLYMQCLFLDERILGYNNFYTFRRRYAVMVKKKIFIPGVKNADGSQKSRWFDQVVDYKNLDRLRDRVAPYRYRVLKKDCLDLKPRTYTSRDVRLSDEQRKMIRDLKLFGHAAIGETGRFVTTDMVIKYITRVTQIACGYVMDDEERVLHEVKEHRTDALMEVLEEHRGKSIIWCPWRAPLEKIVRRITEEYGSRSVAQFHGGNKARRGEEERRFLGDPACRHMAATQGAGMRGNTWNVADLSVYYANNYDLEQRDQSEDRNFRIGQDLPVTVVDLLAEGTHDRKVVVNLRKKIDLATLINDEGYREWLI